MVNSKVSLNKTQTEAVAWGNGPLLIIAGAGTGKTTVVTERIKHLILEQGVLPSEVLALTFTEKAAREMQERVDVALPYGYTQMWISTFHSFGDRVLKNDGVHIGLDPRYRLLTEAEAINFLRKHIFDFDLSYFRPLGNPTKFLSGIFQHFSRLQDEDISPREYLAWAKNLKDKNLETAKWFELANAYCKYEELKNKEGFVDFSDLIYNALRLFRQRPNVLETYRKQFKYILVDEFQDTNIAQNELIKLLAGKVANLTVVADDDQCLPGSAQISTPKGSIAIKDIKRGDEVITAVGKGYLSTSTILRVNKTKKKARFLTFITESGKKLEATDNHKLFCMVPGKKYGNTRDYFVYLMWRSDMGWRLGITDDLAQRVRLERSADKIVGIKHCSSIEELRFFETVFSLKYQIPTCPFKPRRNMSLTGEWLSKLYSSFDTEKNARKLAKDLGIDLDGYHYCLAGVVRGSKERVKIKIKMCFRAHRTRWAHNRLLDSPKILHEVVLETSSSNVKVALENAGIVTRKAKKGWIIRKYFSGLEEAGKFAKKLHALIGGFVETTFDVGKRDGYSRPALVMHAGNVLNGMRVPVLQGSEVVYEKVVERTEETREETVYDLEIDRTHNFIANGVVVHNSIYKWRGAAASNVIQFRQVYAKAKVIALTENYRSTQNILDTAYKLIQFNNPDRLEVQEKIDKHLVSTRKKTGAFPEFLHTDRVENEAEAVAKKILHLVEEEKRSYSDFAILVRANNHSESFVRALARASIPYQFLGPGQLFRQAEVKEIFCYLKVLTNFEDSAAFYKVLTMEHLGLSGRDLAAIVNYSRKTNISLFEAVEKIEDIAVSPETNEKIKKLVGLVRRHLEMIPRETAGQILYYFFQESGLLEHIVNPKTVQDEKRAQNIARFFDKLKSYEADHKDASAFAVVDWIELSLDLGESPLASDFDWARENAVNILTIHSAKGLEFPVVFVVNMVDARFPTRERREQIPIPEELIKEVLPEGNYHLQEERRLAYVAATRARDRLYFTAADYYGDGKREKKISLFVGEALGEAVLKEVTTRGFEQLSILDFAPMPTSAITSQPSTRTPHPINYLSYSQIDCFNFCPLHYKMKYILRIPTPPTAAQSFGISLHNTMNDFYSLGKNGSGLGEEEILEIYNKDWVPFGYTSKSHEQKTKEQGREYLVEYLKTELHNPKNLPLDLEKPFLFPLAPKLKLGGKIDRIDKTVDGGIEIIDYKTTDIETKGPPSQKDLEKDLQLSFYALAALEVRDPVFVKDPRKIKLSLYFFNKALKVSITRTEEQLEKAKEDILKAKAAIETSDFACSGNFWCRECEYKLFCEINS